MATKYKKGKNGYYTARVWDGTYLPSGKKRYKFLRSKKSSGDLERQVREFQKQVEASGGASTTDPDITLTDLAKDWLIVCKAQVEPSTRAMYELAIGYFGQIGDMPVRSLEAKHLQILINENSDHPRTCQKIQLTYRQVIKYAVRLHVARPTALDDLCGGASVPKYKAPEKRILKPDELVAIRKADLNVRDRAFLRLLVGCGLRREEALALRGSDIDFQHHTVTINKAVGYVRDAPYLKDTKNHKHRTLPLPKATENALRALLLTRKGSERTGLLFPMVEDSAKGEAGGPMTNGAYQSMWRRIRDRVQREMAEPVPGFTAHVCRHNYCTQLCYQVPGISLNKVADMLGDSLAVTLKVYSHIMEEKENISGVVTALEEMMG